MSLIKNTLKENSDATHSTQSVPVSSNDLPHNSGLALADSILSTLTPQRSEIVFIESNVSDYQTLIDGVNPDAEVHVLDASQDGLAQMAQILGGRSGIDAIHIVSHGSEGSVNLGSLKLTSQNLQDHAADLATIGNALSQNGDILLYGCDVAAGSDGAAFINALAQTTQADVGASTDATGSAARGGDWSLETSTGVIDEPALSISSYSELLVAVDFTGDTGDTNNTNATVAGGSKNTVTITDDSSGHILKIDSVGTTMYQDTAVNLNGLPFGVALSGDYTGGLYISTDTNAWTTSLTFTVQGGKLFDFSSIKLQEANTDSPTFVFTSSKGSASSAYTGGQFKTIDLSADTNFQNITYVIMTVTGGGNGGSGFQANLDDITLNNIHLPDPTVTSATYNGSTNVLTVTGTGMTAGDSIDATKLTLTGEAGGTYALNGAYTVTASSTTQFSLTLTDTDAMNVEGLLNYDGTVSVTSTTYNIAAAADWDTSRTTAADPTGNGVTVSSTQNPAITSSTYDANTGVLTVTGTNLVAMPGATNDITANKLTLKA